MHGAGSGNAPNRHRHTVSVVHAAVSCALAVAACGSSGKSSSAGASGGPLLKLAECMRSHGVPNFPDPGANGGGLVIPNNHPGSGNVIGSGGLYLALGPGDTCVPVRPAGMRQAAA